MLPSKPNCYKAIFFPYSDCYWVKHNLWDGIFWEGTIKKINYRAPELICPSRRKKHY